jgi:hypothetical protein
MAFGDVVCVCVCGVWVCGKAELSCTRTCYNGDVLNTVTNIPGFTKVNHSVIGLATVNFLLKTEAWGRFIIVRLSVILL